MEAEELRLFAQIYGMFGSLFGEPPRPADGVPAPASEGEEAQENLSETMAGVMVALRQVRQDPAAAAAAAADYERLFVGPDHLPAPPWESVYRTEEHLLCGAPCLEVRAAYRAAGLEVTGGHAVPDDHISFELAFMSVLCSRAAEALERGEDPEPWLSQRSAFLREHLLTWAPAFAADVQRHAATDYYRALALWLSSWLDLEASLLGETVEGRA